MECNHEFKWTLYKQDGEVISVEAVNIDKSTVIFKVPSVTWCPWCGTLKTGEVEHDLSQDIMDVLARALEGVDNETERWRILAGGIVAIAEELKEGLFDDVNAEQQLALSQVVNGLHDLVAKLNRIYTILGKEGG